MKQIFNKIINWISKHKIILLVVLVVAGLFYWYSLRPSFIKKDCYNVATEKAKGKRKEAGATDGKFSKDDYDAYYKFCLQKNGL